MGGPIGVVDSHVVPKRRLIVKVRRENEKNLDGNSKKNP